MDILLIVGIVAVVIVSVTLGLFYQRIRGPAGGEQSPKSRIWPGFAWLRDEARSRSVLVCAGSGSGKSFGVGQDLLPRDFLNEKNLGGLVLDPTGSVTDNFFHWLLQYTDGMSSEARQQYWTRVHYVDMGCEDGYVTPWPLYVRGNEQESLFSISQRYLEVIGLLDPHLMSSSIEGFNAIQKIGTNVGMILAALNLQVTEIEDLLHHSNSEKWKRLYQEAVKRYPEVKPAVDFIKQNYNQLKPDVKERKTGSLLNKIDMFNKDPVQRALYGAGQPGMDWKDLERGHWIFVDFRHVRDSQRRRFGLMWLFRNFMDFIEGRGPGRNKPIVLIMDELSQFITDTVTGDAFGEALNHMLAVVSRQYGVWGVYMLQGLWQCGDSELLKETLLSCANHALGVCTDSASALRLAEKFYPYQPGIAKWTEPVFAGSPPTEIYRRVVPYTPQEWYYQASKHFTQLGRFRFLIKAAQSEGDLTGELEPMTLEHMAGNWVNKEQVAHMRKLLAARDGKPIKSILAEIEGRLARLIEPSKKLSKLSDESLVAEPGMMEMEEHEYSITDQPDHLPVDASGKGRGNLDALWN